MSRYTSPRPAASDRDRTAPGKPAVKPAPKPPPMRMPGMAQLLEGTDAEEQADEDQAALARSLARTILGKKRPPPSKPARAIARKDYSGTSDLTASIPKMK